MSRTAFAILALLLMTAGAALGQEPVLAPLPGAQTECNPNGGRFAWNPAVVFRGTVQSGRLRYGPCFGGASTAGCDDNTRKCLVSEADENEINNKFTALLACRKLPVRFPTKTEIYDIGLTLGTLNRLRSELAKCEGSVAPPAGCPVGQECRPPCPAVQPCPPAEAPFLWTAERLPEPGRLVEAWLQPGLWVLGARQEGRWLTCRGLRTDAEVSAWREAVIP